MIYPKNNQLIRGFFRLYLPWIIRRNFKGVTFDQVDIDPDKPVLLLANHYSWWDAFLLYYVFSKLCNKRLYVMVLEETMKQQQFLKYIGSFSVSKNSRQVVASVNYAAELLQNPTNLVLLFPQGKLHSNFVTDVDFRKGALSVMEKAIHPFQLIYAATFTENFQHKKPTANVYLTQATNCIFEDIAGLNADYQQHYNAARQRQTQIVI
ncbi:MAG: 1-acyl-sn-glycerol-3-phosphate acyltransferase [Mucilaginibacter sp.]